MQPSPTTPNTEKDATVAQETPARTRLGPHEQEGPPEKACQRRQRNRHQTVPGRRCVKGAVVRAVAVGQHDSQRQEGGGQNLERPANPKAPNSGQFWEQEDIVDGLQRVVCSRIGRQRRLPSGSARNWGPSSV